MLKEIKAAAAAAVATVDTVVAEVPYQPQWIEADPNAEPTLPFYQFMLAVCVANRKAREDKEAAAALEEAIKYQVEIDEMNGAVVAGPNEKSEDTPSDDSAGESNNSVDKFADSADKFTANIKNQTTLASFPEGFFLKKFDSIKNKFAYGTSLEDMIEQTPVGTQSAIIERNGFKLIVTATKLGVVTVGLSDNEIFITSSKPLQETDLIKQHDVGIENLRYILGEIEEGSANISDVIARLNHGLN